MKSRLSPWLFSFPVRCSPRPYNRSAAEETKAILPGGESPAEAFRRVFAEYTKGGTASTEVKGENGENIVKVASTDVQGNVVEYKTKTNTIKENSKELKGDTVITQITNGGNNIQSSNSSNTFAGKLNTAVDPFHDKFAAASFAT